MRQPLPFKQIAPEKSHGIIPPIYPARLTSAAPGADPRVTVLRITPGDW